MQLHVVVTDLEGNVLARVAQYESLEVADALNDTRTARLTISIYDAAAALVRPLSRGIKVIYGDALIFNGLIVQPTTNYGDGTVEIIAHDPTIKLKQHYHRYGDIVVAGYGGYPVDGRGMRRLIESSIPNEPQLERDIPGNHILWGVDSTSHQAARGDTNDDGTPAMWRDAERGQNVWESLTNVSAMILGPDFRFRPVDADHPGVQGVPPAGFMVEFDTYDALGDDRTDSVVFQCGFGADNAETITHEPDGASCRNYFVQVPPGGERGPTDDDHRALAHNEASWREIGIYMGFESSGQKTDKHEQLQAKANAWVKAYATPPDFFSVTPRIDAPGVPQYAHDYFVGDLIAVQARRGYREFAATGRIMAATVRQVDPAGNTRVDLECVPNIDPDLDTGPDS